MTLFCCRNIAQLTIFSHSCSTILGVNEFLRQYVVGFAEGGFDYNAIPLERQAYELQRRFEILPPGMTFSVREDIRRFLGA